MISRNHRIAAPFLFAALLGAVFLGYHMGTMDARGAYSQGDEIRNSLNADIIQEQDDDISYNNSGSRVPGDLASPENSTIHNKRVDRNNAPNYSYYIDASQWKSGDRGYYINSLDKLRAIEKTEQRAITEKEFPALGDSEIKDSLVERFKNKIKSVLFEESDNKSNTAEKNDNKKQSDYIAETPVPGNKKVSQKMDSQRHVQAKPVLTVDDTAKFMGACGVSRESPAYRLTEKEEYKKFKKRINQSWQRFQGPNLKKISEWSKSNIKDASDVVLYPFSGPDIINALALYPEAEKYILFGLEPVGHIPDPGNMKDSEIRYALQSLMNSLGEILKVNFFITKEMAAEIGNSRFNGIIGVMMFLLARYDCDIHAVKYVRLDEEGRVSYKKTNSGKSMTVPGCEIRFSSGDDKRMRQALYFRVDVRDSLIHKTPLLKYLERQERFSTLIKAASYLMHETKIKHYSYKEIRSLILRRSKLIIQDDSGIPFSCFSRSAWDLEFFGKYTGPIPVFRHRYQKDLYKHVLKNSRGQLPFSYGYSIYPANSHLIVGRAKGD